MSAEVLRQRRAGVVLHPTSLPGPHGSGDLGPNAYYFVDWLHTAGQTLWQTLPLGPIGPGNSPYMSQSAMAGNPLLVALEPLVEQGWLDAAELRQDFDPLRVDYARVVPWRMQQLRRAFDGFLQATAGRPHPALQAWREAQAWWLQDYVLFMALDQAHGSGDWTHWPPALARREPAALQSALAAHGVELEFWSFVQWQFDLQWQALKDYAHSKQVLLVGDLPIFVAHHSADCWANAHLFELDAQGQPRVVAGVPPDFFSQAGQLWGNPLYNWPAMRKDNYRWWVARLRRQYALSDIVRIDHFRGFVDYWEIDAGAPSALQGRWQSGPGQALFDALKKALGELPIIAEDLGIITDEVHALRDYTGFPGMRVLQFAFGGDASHPYLPHNFEANTVVYTGTHDNDTARGWWASCSARERAFARQYLACDDANMPGALLRAALLSVAAWSMCPFQDVLGLDGSHRMNTPGALGCWSWRFSWDWVGPEAALQLSQLSALGGRCDLRALQLPD